MSSARSANSGDHFPRWKGLGFKKPKMILAFNLLLFVYVAFEFFYPQIGFSTGREFMVSQGMENPPENLERAIEGSGYVFRNATWKYDVGKWLHLYDELYSQVTVHEKFYDNNCPNQCSVYGVCNYEIGECRCRLGYKGPDCTDLEVYPCNLPPTKDFPNGPSTYSACPAQCIERTAKCRCGYNSKFPNRYVSNPCGFLRGPIYTGIIDSDTLYSTNKSKIGWCNAEPGDDISHLDHCECVQDGMIGRLCEVPSIPYCVNGCHGNGKCEGGHCKCKDGWYGIDCSIPSIKAFEKFTLPPWLTNTTENPIENEIKEASLLRRRSRPLVYIYDLPGKFNFHLLEGRHSPRACIAWGYGVTNETVFVGSLYAMEMAVYEALFSSQHRTTNAEHADYFFVPVLGGCIIPQFGESPKFGRDPKYMGYRQYMASEYYLEAYEYVQQTFPYWNRTEGRDHIWLFPWDEGSCVAPAKIWNSIMLTSYGNTMTHHPNSTTTYLSDSWDFLPFDLRGDHPCYQPEKDIVLPAWKDPNPKIVSQELRERKFEDRKILFYFNGNLGFNYTRGRPEPGYSMGIRQKVAYYFGSMPNIHGDLGIKAQSNVIVKSVRAEKYAEELASSRFCGAFPGDGFSARMEDAILSGCIPVIIQDGIHLAFENFLNFDNFTIRIQEEDIPDMITILESISEDRVRSMLNFVSGLWQRYGYYSVGKLEAKRQLEQFGHAHDWAKALNQLEGDDAIDTLFQILNYKLHNDPWRKELLPNKS